MLEKVLLIGTKPFPIGGVTIYNQRLSDQLKEIYFFDYKRKSFFQLLKKIPSYKVIHLSCSHSLFRMFIILYCFILRKKTINTIHGNLGRFGKIKNTLDYLAIYLTTLPIVLNKNSLQKALKYNRNTLQQTSFIKPFYKEDSLLKKKINHFIGKSAIVFSTNAFNLSFDKNKNETYGIVELIKIFSKAKFKKYKFIISTPNKKYKRYLIKKNIYLSSNILMISQPHSFLQVIKSSHAMIRNTTTDGDPLSVREALFYGKKVICSDVVNRPDNVLVYSNSIQLEKIIENIESYPYPSRKKDIIKDESKELKKIYLDLLNGKVEK